MWALWGKNIYMWSTCEKVDIRNLITVYFYFSLGNSRRNYTLFPRTQTRSTAYDIPVLSNLSPEINQSRSSSSWNVHEGNSSRKMTKNSFKCMSSVSTSANFTHYMLLRNYCLHNGKPPPNYKCEATSKHQYVCKVYVAKTCGWVNGAPAYSEATARELAAKEILKKIGFWMLVWLDIVQSAHSGFMAHLTSTAGVHFKMLHCN